MHLISKMRDYDPNDGNKSGGRIGIILNGSPLFTGGAGSGESEIRRHILESDLLEAIVALPTDMFYTTGIATYVWILSNKKDPERKGKVQLINGVHLHQKMRKSLGSKRQEIGEHDIALITRTFGALKAVASYSLDKDTNEKSNRGRPAASKKKAEKKTFGSKIFASHEFGYRRITVERPLRLSVQFTVEPDTEIDDNSNFDREARFNRRPARRRTVPERLSARTTTSGEEKGADQRLDESQRDAPATLSLKWRDHAEGLGRLRIFRHALVGALLEEATLHA